MKSKLFFNGILRSLLETYLQLSINSLGSLGNINLNGSRSQLMSSVITVGLLLVVTVYPIFVYKFLKAN